MQYWVDDIKPHIIGITDHGQTMIEYMLNWDGKVMRCLGKTEWGAGEEEFYYTSMKLYQHTKYSYRKKQIVRRPYGATYSYRTYNNYNWSSISLSQHNHTEQRKNT